MKAMHPYIAAFLLALWWLLRERWDTLPTFAAAETPWYVWAQLACMVLIVGVLCGKQLKAGAVAAWGWVRGRMPQEPGSYLGPFVGLFFGIVLGLGIGFLAAGGVRPSPPSPPTPDVVVPTPTPDKVSRVTYVYEKDDGMPPSEVLAAIGKLNKQGILATTFEDDTKDPSGEVPDQYKVAIEAVGKAVPALVVEKGKYAKVTPKPTTEAQVLEAAK